MSGNSASTHPCFSEDAHYFYSRLHLPVARACNLQCNYCNRKYDCVNESRPGVSSRLLTPQQAFRKVLKTASEQRDLSVIGIAGPGDPLANPEQTFDTFQLIKDYFPDLHFCLSTNGLKVIDSIREIVASGINHVTVTINTLNPETATRIYSWVKIDGRRERGSQAMKHFLSRQQAGLKVLIQKGILVKVNSVLIPGINDKELILLSKKLKLMGIGIQNIVPLIAKPEYGCLYGTLNQAEPTHRELEDIRERCGSLKQMSHCRQCRADAEGRLARTNAEKESGNDVDLIEADFGFEKRKSWQKMVGHLKRQQEVGEIMEEMTAPDPDTALKIAVCSRGMGFADLEIDKANEIFVYRFSKGRPRLLNIRKTFEDHCSPSVTKRIETIADCDAVLSNRFGYNLFRELEQRGIIPISDLSSIPVEKAVCLTAQRLGRMRNGSPSTRLTSAKCSC